MLPSIAASSSGHWNQDGSRRWQRSMRPAASMRSQTSTSPRNASTSAMPSHGPLALERDAHCAFAADRPASARSATGSARSPGCGSRRARVDVALVQHRHLEVQPVVGRIADRPARVEVAARGAADKAAGAEPARQLGRQDAGADGAVLQRGGLVVELHQRREARAYRRRSAHGCRRHPSESRSTATPPGTMQSIIRRWPKQAAAQRSTRSRSMPQCASMRLNDASLQIAPKSPRWLAIRSSSAITPRSQTARGGGSMPSAALDGASEREGIGDRAVARDAAGEPRRVFERRAVHQVRRCPCAHSRAAARAAPPFRRRR